MRATVSFNNFDNFYNNYKRNEWSIGEIRWKLDSELFIEEEVWRGGGSEGEVDWKKKKRERGVNISF